MANLLWHSNSKPRILNEIPFKTEEEFERIVFDSKDFLPDIITLKRQIRGGRKSGIPDIIGINTDGDVCIIEMKNETVEPKIISQVLEYAIWAETNPDSIRVLWQDLKDAPEDIEIDWDNLEIRILVIAPKITQAAVDLSQKIGYNVDFIEINRWIHNGNQFYLLKKIEKESKQPKIKSVHGKPVYDDKYYMKNRNIESAKNFIKYSKEISKIVKNNKWDLETKYNREYCGYKFGFFNAFGINWLGTKSFAIFVKITEKEAKSFKIQMTKYDNTWKQAIYKIEPGKTNISDFIIILKFAYEKLKGK
ncbi:MAG: hypothetical protein WC358_07380 [Ignavibacteria bacterium]|jgi:hypothetical protein